MSKQKIVTSNLGIAQKCRHSKKTLPKIEYL